MISVSGVSTKKKELIEKIAWFFMRELRILRVQILFRSVDIPIGDANFEHDDGMFIIEISRHSTGEELIRSIAHELIHVEQFHSGRLKIRGLTEIFDGIETSTLQTRYHNLPSEIDAYQREEELYKKCLDMMSIFEN